MKSLLFVIATAACTQYPALDQPDAPVVTPESAEAATYMILTPGGSLGTAWAVDDRHVITAGHVCKDGVGDFVLKSTTGRMMTATALAWEDDDEDMTDICVLEAHSELGPALPLASEMPREGDVVGFVGYPLGVLTHSEGAYVGDVDGPVRIGNDYVSTAPCDHGASGSAMYYRDGVYGVLVRLVVVGDQVLPGDQGCAASPLSQIVDILDSI